MVPGPLSPLATTTVLYVPSTPQLNKNTTTFKFITDLQLYKPKRCGALLILDDLVRPSSGIDASVDSNGNCSYSVLLVPLPLEGVKMVA